MTPWLVLHCLWRFIVLFSKQFYGYGDFLWCFVSYFTVLTSSCGVFWVVLELYWLWMVLCKPCYSYGDFVLCFVSSGVQKVGRLAGCGPSMRRSQALIYQTSIQSNSLKLSIMYQYSKANYGVVGYAIEEFRNGINKHPLNVCTPLWASTQLCWLWTNLYSYNYIK